MSDNIDDLLASVDEENDDYDLGDDEEDALLDDSFEHEIGTRNQPSRTGTIVEIKVDPEQESELVLDLDDGTELNDEEDNETINTTYISIEEEQERTRKTSKFSNERVAPNVTPIKQELEPKNISNRINIQGKQYQKNNNFRGRGRGGNRGHYQNNQNRNAQSNPKKKVLINPHFKGNVQIKNNVSLAWNNDLPNNCGTAQNKKPVMYIQPWAQNAPPVQNNFVQPDQGFAPQNIYGNPVYQQPQTNSRPPVHQRLGINPNFNSQILDNQPIQTIQPQQYQQIMPQNHISNQMYDQTQQFHNFNMNPQFSNQQSFNQPPMYNNQVIYPNQAANNFNSHYQNYQVPIQVQQPPVFVPPYNNEFIQNNNFPPNIPVQVIENRPPHEQNVGYQTFSNHKHQNRKFQPGSPGKRKFDNFNADLKKKKRNFPSTNLHEVTTVDTSNTFNEDSKPVFVEEDEEMRAYRLKIEQQKMIREKILRQKEERRKQAAKKMQAEEEYRIVLPPNEIIKSVEIPVITNVNVKPEVMVTNKHNKKSPPVNRTNLNIVPIKTINTLSNDAKTIKRVVTQNVKNVGNRVVVKDINNVSANVNVKVNESSESLSKDHLNPFLANRKVFAKDQSLIDTSVVVVNNLATGTSEVKLRKLCQGVGDVQNLQISTQERQATIQFKSVASAHAFFKKYQRFMLDLSMIQVVLKPMS